MTYPEAKPNTSGMPAGFDTIERRLMMAHAPARKLDTIREFLGETRTQNASYALGLAMEGLRIATQLRDDAAAADMLVHCGSANQAMGRLRPAAEDYRKAHDLFGELGDRAGAARSAVALGNTLSALGEQREALVWFRSALETAEGGGLPEQAADAYEALGALRTGLGDYPAALEHNLACLAIRETLGDDEGIGSALAAVGVVYERSGDRDAAYDYFSRSLAVFRRTGSRYHEVDALTHLGAIHIARGELSVALEHMLRALTIYEALGDTGNVGRVMTMIGTIYEEQREHGTALDYQMRAYALVDQADDDEFRVSILVNMGRIHLASEQYDDALFVLDQALRMATALGNRRLQYAIHEALSSAYERLGRPVQALDHHKQFAALRNEIAGDDKQRSLAELQVRFEVDKAEREREIYRLKAQQLELEMRHKQNELAALALNLVQKKELLDAMREQIKALRTEKGTRGAATIDHLVEEIERSHRSDADWKAFEQQLDLLHHDFVRTLSDRFPTLTPTELKICSLVRIDLSTKDIANLLFTSVRTVHAHKYNIRKKLELESGANLATFLAAL